MTDDVKHENSDDLFAADELSDEALDRAFGQGGKAYSLCPCACGGASATRCAV